MPESSKEPKEKNKEKKEKRAIHHKVIAKKPYIEFITAFMSVPLSITWLLLNMNNIKNINTHPTPTPAPTPIVKTIIQEKEVAGIRTTTTTNTQTSNPSITPTTLVKVVEKDACKKGLGPVSIVSPAEGDVVTDNPVMFTINYDTSTYCSAVWSYRVNGGEWSDYSDTSVGVYNLPEGPVTFELHVKSVVNNDVTTLVRKFIYKSQTTTASSSAR